MFGMLFVALKDFQTGLQQIFEFRVACRGDQLGLQRGVDLLMIGNLVGDIGLVVGGAFQLGKFGALVGSLLGQGLAGVVVFRRHIEFFDKVECLLVHGCMITLHVL